MNNLTIALLGIGAFGICLFLYAELVLLKVPFNELLWRKRKTRPTRVEQLEAALYDIEQEALSYNHYGYAKKARDALEKK